MEQEKDLESLALRVFWVPSLYVCLVELNGDAAQYVSFAVKDIRFDGGHPKVFGTTNPCDVDFEITITFFVGRDGIFDGRDLWTVTRVLSYVDVVRRVGFGPL